MSTGILVAGLLALAVVVWPPRGAAAAARWRAWTPHSTTPERERPATRTLRGRPGRFDGQGMPPRVRPGPPESADPDGAAAGALGHRPAPAPRGPASPSRARWPAVLRRPSWWPGRPATPSAADVVTLLDGFAAGLAAGLPPGAALEVAADAVSPATRAAVATPVLAALVQGRASAPAWNRVARVTGIQHLRSVARAVGLGEQLGTPPAQAVRAACEGMRRRIEHQRRLDAALAGPRATMTVLTLLPLVGVPLAMVVGSSPPQVYGHPAALISLAGGLVLMLLGRRWAAALLRRAQRPMHGPRQARTGRAWWPGRAGDRPAGVPT